MTRSSPPAASATEVSSIRSDQRARSLLRQRFARGPRMTPRAARMAIAALSVSAGRVGASAQRSLVAAFLALRPKRLNRPRPLGASVSHWQRSERGTPANTCSTWAPQPAHVFLPHRRHVTARHIRWRVSWSQLATLAGRTVRLLGVGGDGNSR